MFPTYTKSERIADALVHVAGVAFAIGAVVALAIASQALHAEKIAALSIYGFGLLAMFGASASYNLIPARGLKEILRRVDHAAIFVMIAGSYTPFAIVLGGVAGSTVLAVVWAIAALGVFITLRYPRRFEGAKTALYLAQGWIVLFALGPLIDTLPERSLFFLIAGGVIYTAGVAFHLMRWMRFHNVIWHVFVLCAAVCHLVAIQEAVIP